MKIVKIGSTKLTGKLLTGKTKLSKAERRQKRRMAIAIQTRSNFTPPTIEKPTKAKLNQRAREMRKHPTFAERRIMERLDEIGIRYKFQQVIGWYIADFLIEERILILEIDGSHHYSEQGEIKDFKRTKWLAQFGFKLLRIPNENVNLFNLAEINQFPAEQTKQALIAIKMANKERNRALYYAPVQQERWKAKRKRKQPIQDWERVPQINDRGRIVKILPKKWKSETPAQKDWKEEQERLNRLDFVLSKED